MKVSVRSPLIAGVAAAVVVGGVIAVPTVEMPTTPSASRISSETVLLVAGQPMINTNVASLNLATDLSGFSEAADELSKIAAARPGATGTWRHSLRRSPPPAVLAIDADVARLRVQTIIRNLVAAWETAKIRDFGFAMESATLAVRKLLQQLGLDKFVKPPRAAGIPAPSGDATPAAAATRGTAVRVSSASARRLASPAAASRPAGTPIKLAPLESAASLASRHSPSAKAAAATAKTAPTAEQGQRRAARGAVHRAERSGADGVE
jgi:hypothetical protein